MLERFGMMKFRTACITGILVIVFCLFFIFLLFFWEEDCPVLKKEFVPGTAWFEGEFSLRVCRPLNRTTLVRYIVPVDPATGMPVPEASNIIFYAPFNGDAPRIRKMFPPWLRCFAEHYRYTVFTLTIEADKLIVGDAERYYIYREAGWFEQIFKLKKHLEREFGLRANPLLIVGESSGGSMAERMIAHYPERISAAAWNGGSNYTDLPVGTKTRILALNTEGCYGTEATARLVRHSRAAGINILHGITQPRKGGGRIETHAPTSLAYKLMQTFITSDPEFEKLWMEAGKEKCK